MIYYHQYTMKGIHEFNDVFYHPWGAQGYIYLMEHLKTSIG